MKRTFDLVFSLGGLCLLWPLFAIIAALIRWHDGGAVFFRQQRVGLSGEPFRILKFRTMVEDAESLGLQITAGNDRRITPVGRWLRRLKLDEFPQLINVVRGEMSLVGPRPEVPKYVALYSVEQRRVLDCKPGITDPASLQYFDESALLHSANDSEVIYVTQIMPAKLAINMQYAGSATLASDVQIIVRTLLRLGGWTGANRQPVGREENRQAA